MMCKIIDLLGFKRRREEKKAKADLCEKTALYEEALRQGMCDICGLVGQATPVIPGQLYMCDQCMEEGGYETCKA